MKTKSANNSLSVVGAIHEISRNDIGNTDISLVKLIVKELATML